MVCEPKGQVPEETHVCWVLSKHSDLLSSVNCILPKGHKNTS